MTYFAMKIKVITFKGLIWKKLIYQHLISKLAHMLEKSCMPEVKYGNGNESIFHSYACLPFFSEYDVCGIMWLATEA